jgi:5'-nucleotidase/UDP-sugar diphosphatase
MFTRLLLALAICSTVGAEVRTLTILHTNDLHARLTPLDNGTGGFAYLATVIRRERANCTDCVLLSGGDLVQGTPVSTIFHGLPAFEIGNLLGIDAAALGNHEFDYGWMQTRKFVQTAVYPVVSANVVNSKNETITKPYVILQVNGLRVAVIGAMTNVLRTFSTPALMGDWTTIDSVDTARRYARELKSQSDLVVVAAHITGEEEAAFLEKAVEVPVILSGHIHRGIDEAMTKDGRILVRVKGYGEELGRLELKVDTEKKAPVSWTWKRIPVDSRKEEPAPDVAKLVKYWEGEVASRVDQPLAVSTRHFGKAEVKRLIERAMRDQTGADFAFMNLGGVRDVVPEGKLLVRNIWNIMPFDNTVVVGTFKGRDLPHVVLGDRKVEPNRDYTLAVSDFTAINQATNENLQTTGLKFPNEVGLLRDLLIDWFKKKKVIDN